LEREHGKRISREKESMKEQNVWQEVKDILRQKQFGKLFSGDTENTLIQFFRYCFVDGAATVVDWGVSSLLFYFVFAQAHAVVANAISFVLGLIVNYLLSILWIFKKPKTSNRFVEFLGFAVIGVVGLLLTMGITKLFEWWLADITITYQIIGKIVSTAVAFFWNFFARKYLLFSDKKEG